VIDNDLDIAEVARAVLTDEGYQVSVLADLTADAIAAAVGRLEPDVVLLDGESHSGRYGSSWEQAAALSKRTRRVPVVMFSAHGIDVDEARLGTSARSRAADFAGIVPKPFDVDTLLDVVAQAAGASVPFDRSVAADVARSDSLARDLEARGAREVRTSARREWVTFRTPSGVLMQVYWWQTGGAYLVGRYDEDGRRIVNVASSHDRDAALEICAAAMREHAADAAAQ
jgi:CheY-like chemotaxis protein